MAKKKTEIKSYPIRLIGETDKDGERIEGLQDPETGRKWVWRSSDYPGLGDFLHDTLLIGWHPFALTGSKSTKGRKLGSSINEQIAKTRARQIANAYTELAAENPQWYAKQIEAELMARFNIKKRQLDTHLTDARDKGLLPKRHRRKNNTATP